MTAVFSFQTHLVSIMDALSKAVVMEISKLVEIESKMLKIEITRGRNEIASLTEKLKLMEKLLYIAQGSRQNTAAAACLRVRGGLEDRVAEPDRTGRAIGRDHPEERGIWSSDRSSLHQSEDPAAELPNPPKELEVLVVKEEPSELVIKQDRACDTGKKAVTDTEKSPEVRSCPKPSGEHQQPLLPDSLVILSTQSHLSGTGPMETQWSSEVTQTNTNHEAAKNYGQNIASQNFSMHRNVKLHNLRNSVTKRLGCLQCGKNFRCFSQLEIHQRSHTGEKPFRCSLCGKRYAQKGHLYTHQRTHTGEKPYRCSICGKGFTQKCTLDMHLRTHTGEKPFVCMKCGKGFTKNCNLKKHLATHLE